MDRLRQKLSSKPTRRKATRRRTQSEVLEERTYLSVTSLFSGGELQIASDGPDSITVGTDPLSPGIVQVMVNGADDPTLGTIQANTVTSIVVIGSDTDNVIDLSGVTAAEFSFFDAGTGLGVQISVDGDDGNDTIIGSPDLGSTLIGGDGADTITGSAAAESIAAGDGNDSIISGDGNDTILGGNGNDIIDSGTGDDNVDAGDGDDSVTGGDGSDTITGADGADTIDGGAGNDDINGMSGLDSLIGGDGDDTVLGGSETDLISGGAGDDIVNGQAGNDTVNGDTGNDTALGGGGSDALFGSDGDDILNGQSGNDSLSGETGLDRIYGGGGNDSLLGGDDTDTIRGQSGNDTLVGGAGTDLLFGGSGNDLIGISSTVSISDASITEGNPGGTSEAVFTVTVDGNDASPITVDFATADDSALAGLDYVQTSGQLTFAPGQTQLTINVPVITDSAAEGNEFFFVNLLNASSNTEILDAQGIATIIDDDVTTSAITTSSFPQNWDRSTGAMQWVVRVAPAVEMETLSASTGTRVTESRHLDDVYIVEIPDGGSPAELIADLETMSEVIDFYPLEAVNAQVRAVPDDPLYVDQWHLNNVGQTGGTPGADANVESVWDTYRGTGVTIGIVDDGLEHTHPDLTNNYDATLSFDYFAGDADPIPDAANQDFHGTAVAGVAAADGFNTLGVSGAAPDATLAGIRLVAGFFTDQQSADALGHMTQQIDVSNNSWGPADSGVLGPIGPLTQAAIINGATTGRGGLGTIYVWAGGNGGDITNDNVNYDAFANSRYTIAVGAIDDDGVRSSYSDPGAPVIVTAYSNSFGGPGITTTDLEDDEGYNSAADASDGDPQPDLDYTSTFGGTSSATPLVSGVIALMLEANPGLSYRDVNHILVNSARMTDPTNADWSVNGAGHDINHEYGFGAIDADAAVTLAETWTNVGAELASTSGTTTVSAMIPDADPSGVTSTVTITDNLSLEYVEVTLNASHNFRGNLEVVLTSPSGSESVLAESRSTDPFADYSNWTFTSARHWDELSQGDWTLSVRDRVAGTVGTFDNWSLNVFGTLSTATPPTPAPPNAVNAGDSIMGDSGDDTIFGTGGRDTINGGSGNDLIDGRGDADIILGGAGRDTLNGGAGNDTLNGQGGADLLSGDDGDDTIIWEGQTSGDDTISSDAGGDTLVVGGETTDDTFSVSQSAASELIITQGTSSITIAGNGIEAGIESVVVNGGSGNDTITITDVDQVGTLVLTVNGGSGADTISATGASLGNVRLAINGDLGDDTLTGSADADTISGGDGNDVISGEAGNDTLSGNADEDVISGGDGNDVVNGNDGNDTALGDAGDDSLLGSFGDDMLTGGLGSDTIDGGFGDDLLNGMSGNDSLLGNFGNDRIAAGAGDDTVNGGNDNDTIQGHSGADLIDGSHGDDFILGQAGNDTIFGDDGNDTIMAGNGNDVAYGEDGDDIIDGEGASDTIVGGDGNDTLRGGGSDDTITGDQGDDVINGNSGNDTASTGEGADIASSVETIDESFVLSTDLIQDFDTLANL